MEFALWVWRILFLKKLHVSHQTPHSMLQTTQRPAPNANTRADAYLLGPPLPLSLASEEQIIIIIIGIVQRPAPVVQAEIEQSETASPRFTQESIIR